MTRTTDIAAYVAAAHAFGDLAGGHLGAAAPAVPVGIRVPDQGLAVGVLDVAVVRVHGGIGVLDGRVRVVGEDVRSATSDEEQADQRSHAS